MPFALAFRHARRTLCALALGLAALACIAAFGTGVTLAAMIGGA